MKIISKFKDFYDFEVSKYGMDEKLIYNRKTSEYANFPRGEYRACVGSDWYKHKILLIGDKTVHLFLGAKKIYSHFDLVDLEVLKENRLLSPYNSKLFFAPGEPKLLFRDGESLSFTDDDYFVYPFGTMLYEMLAMKRKDIIKHIKDKISSSRGRDFFEHDVEENKLYNEPIVLLEYLDVVRDYEARYGSYRVYKSTCNPNLQSMGIYIDPDFTWQSLVEFLSRKRSDKEIMPEIPNDIKIEQHGFDLKTSFRPKMKKKK